MLKVTERMKGLKVDRKAKEVFDADTRVISARKGAGLTKREEGWGEDASGSISAKE